MASVSSFEGSFGPGFPFLADEYSSRYFRSMLSFLGDNYEFATDRALGGPIAAGSADQPDSVHGARRNDGSAAWVYQEVTEDPEGGPATGEGPQS